MPAKKPAKKKTAKKMPKKMAQKGRMSEDMQNAMMMLFAGGMVILAYMLYLTYA